MGFLFGAASSGFQVEGGYNNGKGLRNNWYYWEKLPFIAKSKKAVDFWNRYEEDFDLAQNAGLNAFRLSLESTRLYPEGRRSLLPKSIELDKHAVINYVKIIEALRKRNIEPIVTLHHFTHPLWLGIDFWLDDESPEIFSEMSEMSVNAISQGLCDIGVRPPMLYITINEPNAYAVLTYMLGIFPHKRIGGAYAGKAFSNMIKAHIRTRSRIKDLYIKEFGESPSLSFNNCCVNSYEADVMIIDALCAAASGIEKRDIADYLEERKIKYYIKLNKIPNSYPSSGWSGMIFERLARNKLEKNLNIRRMSSLIDNAYSHEDTIDFIAMDIYDPLLRNIPRLPARKRVFNGDLAPFAAHYEWEVSVEAFLAFSRIYSDQPNRQPLLIAENGMSTKWNPKGRPRLRVDGIGRDQFIERMLRACQWLRSDGCDLRGYIYWSLTDNYEWGSFTPRFGLHGIDYSDNLLRLVSDSAQINSSQTMRSMIEDSVASGIENDIQPLF